MTLPPLPDFVQGASPAPIGRWPRDVELACESGLVAPGNEVGARPDPREQSCTRQSVEVTLAFMGTVKAGAATSSTTKLPAALTTSEKWRAALLVVLGILLTIGVLVWFGLSTEDGGLKSKVTNVSEPVGEGATGTKTTTTTDYADTVVIFALTVGAAFILAGAFYGRLRELKLGGLALGLGELSPEKEHELDAKVDEQVKAEVADPTKQKIVKAAALSLASEEVRSQFWGVVPSPPSGTLDDIARTASRRALETFGS